MGFFPNNERKVKSVVLDFDISWGQYLQTRVTHSLSFCIPGIVPTRESVSADFQIPSNFWTERARLRQSVSVHRIFGLIRRAHPLQGELSPFFLAGACRLSVTERACRPFPTVEPPGLLKRSNSLNTSSSIYVRLAGGGHSSSYLSHCLLLGVSPHHVILVP